GRASRPSSNGFDHRRRRYNRRMSAADAPAGNGNSAAGPPQGANCTPYGGSAAAKPQAWGANMRDVPLVVLIATVWCYWTGVAIMVLRVRRRNRKLVGLVPEQQVERLMWLIWVPLVAAWMFLPYAALKRTDAPFALPAFANAEPYTSLRILAAAGAVVALLATIRCWLRMGDDWRMDIGARKTDLITDGLFRLIRHPIYAFSMLLMICAVVVVPTAAMIAIAAT